MCRVICFLFITCGLLSDSLQANYSVVIVYSKKYDQRCMYSSSIMLMQVQL